MTNPTDPWGEQFNAMSLEDQIESLKSYNDSMLATNYEQAAKIKAMRLNIEEMFLALKHSCDWLKLAGDSDFIADEHFQSCAFSQIRINQAALSRAKPNAPTQRGSI